MFGMSLGNPALASRTNESPKTTQGLDLTSESLRHDKMPASTAANDDSRNPGETPTGGGSDQPAWRHEADSPRAHETTEHNGNSPSSAEEVQYYHHFLDKLLGLISHGNTQTVAQLISVIRSGASHDQILSTIAGLSSEPSTSSAPEQENQNATP
ncbi:hypothetical protein NUU61_003761 [Penicillium alfredii]|uniref:Uncharacterized protein n=1 Tax=Penicillium alfredii TaxID=1506179 RepID=A0A9W9FK21_9EURO|nr:uncharacterized protein NUU61_003761 [Penicillium alfredii]KAJ5101539.1 hypothetical protein NUU61_003761 [Penicillium alfredii]